MAASRRATMASHPRGTVRRPPHRTSSQQAEPTEPITPPTRPLDFNPTLPARPRPEHLLTTPPTSSTTRIKSRICTMVRDVPRAAPSGDLAVLSVWKLAHGQEDYYLDAVAQGVEDYYVGGEAPGRWIASSDRHARPRGQVTPEALRAVLAGHDPAIWDTARPAASGARFRPDVSGAEVRVRVVRTR